MFPNQIATKTLVIIMALGSLSSCKEQPKANIDFLSLSEQEKRNPEYALTSMEVEEGLNLELFASEPMVTNPTNMAIDARGRLSGFGSLFGEPKGSNEGTIKYPNTKPRANMGSQQFVGNASYIITSAYQLQRSNTMIIHKEKSHAFAWLFLKHLIDGLET